MTKAMKNRLIKMRHGRRVLAGRGCGPMMDKLEGMGLVKCHLPRDPKFALRFSITDAGRDAVEKGQ